MLASPMNSAYQNGERFDQVSFVSEEQWRGSSRRDILYGLRGYLYSHGVPHISPFYGGMALVSLFAIVFVATHCSTRILHMDTPWWHQRRRLADEHQEVASNGGKRGDSPPCEWLNNVGKGQVNQKSIGIPTPMVALSGSNTRPAGHGVKVMWETANDEELQRIATLQKESGIPLDSESTLLGERLSESLELLIESALTDVSSLRVEPWLLDPGLEVPEGLLLEGEEEGEGPLPQDFSEAGTSKTWDGMGFGSTVSVSPPAAFGEPSTATMQQLSQQAACAVVTDVQPSSSISSSHGPRIAGNRNAHAHSFLGTAQEAEQGLTSDAIQGPTSNVFEPRNSGLQVSFVEADTSYVEKPQSRLFPSLYAALSQKPSSESGPDLSKHPFYRTPQLLSGVVPRDFNMDSALAAASPSSPLRTLQRISSWLNMEMLDLTGSNLLMKCLEDLVGFAVHHFKSTLKVVRPVFGVETLALYLLIADSLYAASLALGDPAQRNTWWGRIMSALPTNIVLGSHPHPRRASRDLLSLAGRIKNALDIFRSGCRPSPIVLVPLKQDILCSGMLRKFQRGRWKIFKTDDDKWRVYTQKYS